MECQLDALSAIVAARQVPSHIIVHARCSRPCKKRAGSNPVWYMPAGVGTGGGEPMRKTIVLGPKSTGILFVITHRVSYCQWRWPMAVTAKGMI